MPRPKRVYDPLTGAFDSRRSSEPMPVRDRSDHDRIEHEPVERVLGLIGGEGLGPRAVPEARLMYEFGWAAGGFLIACVMFELGWLV
jgi:hypothetical protein